MPNVCRIQNYEYLRVYWANIPVFVCIACTTPQISTLGATPPSLLEVPLLNILQLLLEGPNRGRRRGPLDAGRRRRRVARVARRRRPAPVVDRGLAERGDRAAQQHPAHLARRLASRAVWAKHGLAPRVLCRVVPGAFVGWVRRHGGQTTLRVGAAAVRGTACDVGAGRKLARALETCSPAAGELLRSSSWCDGTLLDSCAHESASALLRRLVGFGILTTAAESS